RFSRDWSSDVCSSDLEPKNALGRRFLFCGFSNNSVYPLPPQSRKSGRFHKGAGDRTKVACWRIDVVSGLVSGESGASLVSKESRSEERRVGKGWRSRW